MRASTAQVALRGQSGRREGAAGALEGLETRLRAVYRCELVVVVAQDANAHSDPSLARAGWRRHALQPPRSSRNSRTTRICSRPTRRTRTFASRMARATMAGLARTATATTRVQRGAGRGPSRSRSSLNRRSLRASHSPRLVATYFEEALVLIVPICAVQDRQSRRRRPLGPVQRPVIRRPVRCARRLDFLRRNYSRCPGIQGFSCCPDYVERQRKGQARGGARQDCHRVRVCR